MATPCISPSPSPQSSCRSIDPALKPFPSPSPLPLPVSQLRTRPQQLKAHHRHAAALFRSRLVLYRQCPTPHPTFAVRAASQLESASPPTSSPDKPIVPDTQFSFTKISLGTVGLGLGSTLLSYGFGAYFNILSGSEWSALMLTYGFPLAIIGMALKYAELKPVPCTSYADAVALRETGGTPTLNQVRNDVTRFRYGDEQHLDEALKRIFRYGQAGGIQRRNAPLLQSIREEVNSQGKYTLVLVFEGKALELRDFEDRQAKFSSFFGPGVTAEIAAGGEKLYEVRLVADGQQ